MYIYIHIYIYIYMCIYIYIYIYMCVCVYEVKFQVKFIYSSTLKAHTVCGRNKSIVGKIVAQKMLIKNTKIFLKIKA